MTFADFMDAVRQSMSDSNESAASWAAWLEVRSVYGTTWYEELQQLGTAAVEAKIEALLGITLTLP